MIRENNLLVDGIAFCLTLVVAWGLLALAPDVNAWIIHLRTGN